MTYLLDTGVLSSPSYIITTTGKMREAQEEGVLTANVVPIIHGKKREAGALHGNETEQRRDPARVCLPGGGNGSPSLYTQQQ